MVASDQEGTGIQLTASCCNDATLGMQMGHTRPNSGRRPVSMWACIPRGAATAHQHVPKTAYNRSRSLRNSVSCAPHPCCPSQTRARWTSPARP